MSFDLRNFIMKTALGMVGKEQDYKVRKWSLGWLDKEVLEEGDIEAIDAAIEAYAVKLAEEEAARIAAEEEAAALAAGEPEGAGEGQSIPTGGGSGAGAE
jgi:hypothetical protein